MYTFQKRVLDDHLCEPGSRVDKPRRTGPSCSDPQRHHFQSNRCWQLKEIRKILFSKFEIVLKWIFFRVLVLKFGFCHRRVCQVCQYFFFLETPWCPLTHSQSSPEQGWWKIPRQYWTEPSSSLYSFTAPELNYPALRKEQWVYSDKKSPTAVIYLLLHRKISLEKVRIEVINDLGPVPNVCSYYPHALSNPMIL